MRKTDDIVFFALMLTIFTASFIKLSTIKIFPNIQSLIYSISNPYIIETFSINELLIVKLFITSMMYICLNLSLEQFIAYIYLQELFLLFIFNKASIILHPSICILLYYVLKHNNVNKYFKNKKQLT